MKLPGKGNSYSHGERPVHPISTIIQALEETSGPANQTANILHKHLAPLLPEEKARCVHNSLLIVHASWFLCQCAGFMVQGLASSTLLTEDKARCSPPHNLFG